MYCVKITVVAGSGDARAEHRGVRSGDCATVISWSANSRKVGSGGQTVPDGNLAETVGADGSPAPEPDEPAMPVMPFPTFQNTPTLPQQLPGNGYESGRDSRAR